MIIDTTKTKVHQVHQCRYELQEFICQIKSLPRLRPYEGITRTVVCLPGMLTSIFVKCWEEQTDLEFNWSRAINGEPPSLVMAELELEANVERISDQLRWSMSAAGENGE